MPTYHYTNLIAELNGLTFRVSGTYHPAEPELEHCPFAPPTFSLKVGQTTVKGQPEADVGRILESMRGQPQVRPNDLGFHHITWTSGFDELETLCLRLVEKQRSRDGTPC